jgi:hypothetical protein
MARGYMGKDQLPQAKPASKTVGCFLRYLVTKIFNISLN